MIDSIDLDSPRRPAEIWGAALRLYRRHPILFFVLAAGVIVPYQLAATAATNVGPLGRGSRGNAEFLVELADFSLVIPLVSALHIHAVALVGRGIRPTLAAVWREGLLVLPVAAATGIMETLGEALGFVLLIVPGIILLLRWNVAVQAAAIEREGWTEALKRSARLTTRNYGRIFGFNLGGGIVVAAASFALLATTSGRATSAPEIVGGIVWQTLIASTFALGTALLYYDLVARNRPRALEPDGHYQAAPRDLDP